LLNLLRGYALLGSLNDQYFGGFRNGHAGHACGDPGLRLRHNSALYGQVRDAITSQPPRTYLVSALIPLYESPTILDIVKAKRVSGE
jgi:hypothetical protein